MNTSYTKQSPRSIPENRSYYPPSREIVASEVNQNNSLSGGRTGNSSLVAGTSANVIASMKSTSSFLTPVLDSERISLCLTSNKISNYTRSTFNDTDLDDRALGASTGISFSGSTISATSSGTIRDEIKTLDIGKEITISGSGFNNSTFTVISVADDGSSFEVSPFTVTETAGQSVVITQHELSLIHISEPTRRM